MAKTPGKKRFQMVTTGFKVAGGALRGTPSLTIHPSGLAVGSVGGSEILDTVAGVADGIYLVKFGVDVASQTVAVFLSQPGDPGCMKIRRYKSKGGSRISFHMGGVFKEHPRLKITSKSDCLVRFDTDADGTAYMEIALGPALGKRPEEPTVTAPPTPK